MAIIKYKNHPSIKAITDRVEKLGKSTFNFKFTSHEEREKEVNNLKIKKTSQKSDIPLKIIKENVDIISYFLYHNFNNSFSCATFPTSMKYADAIPIHKKDDKTDKENYRPISISPNLSKVYARLMYNQIYPEAVVQRCSVKKVFLEISQNSQENNRARVFLLIKLQDFIFFYRTRPVAASVYPYFGTLFSSFNVVFGKVLTLSIVS